jgi:hypothetical protein
VVGGISNAIQTAKSVLQTAIQGFQSGGLAGGASGLLESLGLDASIVGQIRYGSTSVMLTGDAPKSVESYLARLDAEKLEINEQENYKYNTYFIGPAVRIDPRTEIVLFRVGAPKKASGDR